MILAGDIGGTNTRLALFREEKSCLVLTEEQTYSSRQHADLKEIVADFLSAHSCDAEAACFGIAGPVSNGRAVAANLPWVVDSAELSRQTSIASVWLINDLQAHAYGIPDLPAGDFTTLNQGTPAQGNAGLIAAGTGLGEAGMYWDGNRLHAFASEGGHANFAPNGELECRLHAWLSQKFGHVSSERVLSGPGIKNIYDFLVETRISEEPEWLKEELAQAADPVILISEYGLNASAPICESALEMFVSAYGSEAGNLALKLLAVNGMYISGGIAGKIMPIMQKPVFMKAFIDKGRMQNLLQQIPVKVVINDRIGLMGAARYALSSMEQDAKPAYS